MIVGGTSYSIKWYVSPKISHAPSPRTQFQPGPRVDAVAAAGDGGSGGSPQEQLARTYVRQSVLIDMQIQFPGRTPRYVHTHFRKQP